jgi:hypothetical protein
MALLIHKQLIEFLIKIVFKSKKSPITISLSLSNILNRKQPNTKKVYKGLNNIHRENTPKKLKNIMHFGNVFQSLLLKIIKNKTTKLVINIRVNKLLREVGQKNTKKAHLNSITK